MASDACLRRYPQRLSGEFAGTCHAQDDCNGNGEHAQRYRLVQEGCGQRQTEEGLQQLQLAN